MFGTVRKHQKSLWIVIITLTVLSFLIYFLPNSSRMDLAGSDNANIGRINGRPLTPDEVRNARAEELLYFRFTRNEWPDHPDMRRYQFNVERAANSRLIWLEKMKNLKIEASAEATAKMIAQMFGAAGKPFPMADYEKRLAEMAAHGISKSDFERFVSHEVGRQQLSEIYGLGGRLVTPQEAEYLYRQENTIISGEVAVFNGTNYEAKVEATDDILLHYFQLHQANYRVQEKRQIYYVKFPFSKYEQSDTDIMTKIRLANPQITTTNLSQLVDMEYFQAASQNPNAFRDELTGEPLSPEIAKKKIEKELRNNMAADAARPEFQALLKDLYTYREAATNKNDTNFFQKVATEKSLTVSESPLFAMGTVPSGMRVRPEFSRAAFNLSLDTAPYATQPLLGEDGIYVIALKRVEESYMPQYEAIKGDVTKHYRADEGKKLAFQAADKFSEKANAELKAGKSFAQICTAEGVKSVTLPNFTPTEPMVAEWPHASINLNSAQNATGRTEAGHASGTITTDAGAAVLYVKEKAPANPVKMAAELPDFIRTIGEQRQNAAFMQWLNALSQKEIKLELPGDEKETPKQTAQK